MEEAGKGLENINGLQLLPRRSLTTSPDQAPDDEKPKLIWKPPNVVAEELKKNTRRKKELLKN